MAGWRAASCGGTKNEQRSGSMGLHVQSVAAITPSTDDLQSASVRRYNRLIEDPGRESDAYIVGV